MPPIVEARDCVVGYQSYQPGARVLCVTCRGREALDADLEEASKRRAEDVYFDQKVAYLSREDLIHNKEAVGRPQNLVDVELLRLWPKGGSGRP